MKKRVPVDLIIFCATKNEAIAARTAQREPFGRTTCGNTHATVAHLGPFTCVTLASGLKAPRLRQAFQNISATFAPRLFVNFGACGGIDPNLRIGDVTVPREIVLYALPDLKTDEKIIHPPVAPLEGAGLPIHLTRAGTCPQDVRSAETRDSIWSKIGAQTTDWETYRLADRCETQGFPFLAMRCVTDHADTNAGSDYGRHADRVLREAAALLPEMAQRILAESAP